MGALPIMTAHRPDAAPATPPPAELAPMNFIRLTNQFNALENEAFFSDSARGLFQRILYHFNKTRQWEAALPVNVPLLQMLTGSSPNTIVKALAELQARGVVHYVEAPRGRGKTGLLRLLRVRRIKAAAVEEKPSEFDDLNDGFIDDFQPDDAVKPSGKPSGKPSNFDDTIRDVDSKSLTSVEPTPSKKNAEASFSQSPGAASHTGGGAADVGTSISEPEGLRPLREDEYLPVWVNPNLLDSDPKKWEAIPRDAAMVDEYLANHPDPSISQHAGKGELFYNFYKGVGWQVNGRPMMYWRAVVKGWGFVDFKQLRQDEAAAKIQARGGQVDKRTAAVDEATRLLNERRAERERAGNGS
jgi:hypothetical protein